MSNFFFLRNKIAAAQFNLALSQVLARWQLPKD